MILSAHQPQYLPWLGYFDKILKSDLFVFLDCVQYKKREFQNRNKIRTPQGPHWLTVPVVTKGRYTQLVHEVAVDNGTPWAEDHWKALKANYTKAPFFNAYAPFFQKTYETHWERLSDLNIHLIRFLLQCFEIQTPLAMESEVGTENKSTDRLIELAVKLKASAYLSGVGGKDYLEEEKFKTVGLRLAYQDFRHPTYPQLFMKSPEDFLPALSAVDLLFNHGPKAKEILRGHV